MTCKMQHRHCVRSGHQAVSQAYGPCKDVMKVLGGAHAGREETGACGAMGRASLFDGGFGSTGLASHPQEACWAQTQPTEHRQEPLLHQLLARLVALSWKCHGLACPSHTLSPSTFPMVPFTAFVPLSLPQAPLWNLHSLPPWQLCRWPWLQAPEPRSTPARAPELSLTRAACCQDDQGWKGEASCAIHLRCPVQLGF